MALESWPKNPSFLNGRNQHSQAPPTISLPMYLLLNQWEHEGKKGTEQVFCFVLFCLQQILHYVQLGELETCRLPSPSEVFLQRKAGLLASQVIAEMGVNQGEEGGGEVGEG